MRTEWGMMGSERGYNVLGNVVLVARRRGAEEPFLRSENKEKQGEAGKARGLFQSGGKSIFVRRGEDAVENGPPFTGWVP